MATTDLKLDEPGSLQRPGPIGRLVRLAFGAMCLWYVFQLLQVWGSWVLSDGRIRPLIWNGIVLGLFLISYVINIGYSRSWKKWPALFSAVAFLLVGTLGFFATGSVMNDYLATTIWIWLLYLFSHLGIAFVLSGIIGTPGCEMRAFHDLYSRLTGVPTKEHICPVGPLGPVDRWESSRLNRP